MFAYLRNLTCKSVIWFISSMNVVWIFRIMLIVYYLKKCELLNASVRFLLQYWCVKCNTQIAYFMFTACSWGLVRISFRLCVEFRYVPCVSIVGPVATQGSFQARWQKCKRRVETGNYLNTLAQNWQALFSTHIPLSKACHMAKANIKEVRKNGLPAANHGEEGREGRIVGK